MSHYEKGTLLKHRDRHDQDHGLFLTTGQALDWGTEYQPEKEEYQEAYSFKHGCHVRIYVRFFKPVRDVKKEQRA